MAGTTIELQPRIVIKCTMAGNTGEIQDVDGWVDTSRYRVATAISEVDMVDNCELDLEGCDVMGGAFMTHAAFTQALAAACVITLNRNAPYGAPEHLSNLMRWKIVASGNWTASFRITLVLK